MTTRPSSYPLRLPDELKEYVQKSAKQHGRSFNAEVVWMLESFLSLKKGQPQSVMTSDATTEVRALREQVALIDQKLDGDWCEEAVLRALKKVIKI